jgi:PAS domain S-box-containing protein
MRLNLIKGLNENFHIKIFLAFVLVIFLTASSFTLFFLHRQSRILSDALIRNGKLLAGVLAYNSRIGVFSENGDLLEAAADGVLRQEGILQVSIFNRDGALLKSKDRPETKTLEEGRPGSNPDRHAIMNKVRETVSSFSRSGNYVAEFWSPVISAYDAYEEPSLFFKDDFLPIKKEVIGYAMITVDKRPLNKALGDLLIKTLAMAILFMLAGCLIAYLIVRGITRPLNHLIDSVKTFGMVGRVEEIAVETEDEIGKLAQAFNGMTDRLGKREQALRENERELRLLIESAPDAIFIHARGRFVYLNEKAVLLFGAQTALDLLGHPVVDRFHPDDRKSMEKRHSLLVETESIPPREEKYIRMNGAVIDVETSAVPITYENRTATLEFARDIGERKKAEQERQALQERLQRSEKMETVGQLAGGVAHDLNNVLGVSLLYSELLQESIPVGSPLRMSVDGIFSSSQRAAAIIQDLLTLARRNVVVPEVLNLNSVISGFLQTPAFENIKGVNSLIAFRMELDRELPNIEGSPTHLEKTVMNLLSNAAEAISGRGKVTIRTERRYLDRPLSGYDTVMEGDYVVLTVSDTGEGIPSQHLGKIFEPFYTKKSMGKGGTGLGLAIVWNTVKDHKGYIDLQSVEGEGSTFKLFFPATPLAVAEETAKVSIEQYIGHGEAVLVVDDIEEQRQVATAILTRLGYRVNTVSSGEEAVEYLSREKADILILDMIMAPGIDGLETFRRVRAFNPTQKAIRKRTWRRP